MRPRRAVVIALAAASALAFGAPATPAPPQPLPSHAPDLDQIAGVYKHRFANSDMQGNKWTGEDIFEVVKLSPETAYFRVHGEFANGHVCNLWGVADLEPDALVYHGPPDAHDQPCVLKFSVNEDGILTNDVGGYCRSQSCGNRGLYGYGTDVSYPFKARRTIRYMPLILKSSEYAAALTEHAAHPLGTPSPAPKP